MGTPQLISSLSLIILIQIIPSQPMEGGEKVAIQKSGTESKDVVWTMLETRTMEGASVNAAGLPAGFLSDSPRSSRSRPKRHTWEKQEEHECHLQNLLVRIKDLGLGYNSEETIIFKYCSGSCPKARNNHDLALSILLQNSEISAMGDPCCRPTNYEDVAFLDDSHQWHEVEKLSASTCSCAA